MSQRDDDLTRAEDDFAGAVAEALAATADEFADAVAGATELVAARFSVGRIGRRWSGRVTGLVRRLLGVAETAAQAAAEDTGTELPAGWDDLPGRYDDGRALPADIDAYATTAVFLLRAVGDRLAEAARQELAAGIAAGEDTGQLRARLRAAFARDGAQLGPAREERIASTEASRAWNTATLAAARAVTGPDRPLVKQWVTRHDTRVRVAHDQVDGQLRLLSEPFTVAGVQMQTPGDPAAPVGLVINCRCRLAVAPEVRASAVDSQGRPGSGTSKSRERAVLGPKSLTAAGGHTGAMIALVPTAEDAARLALGTPGAEPAEELHLTLFYLGQGADWTDEQRAALITGMRDRVPDIGQAIAGRAFGANQWNGDTDSPCWVWSVGDDPDRAPDDPTLESAHWAAVHALEDLHGQPEIPGQHTPWAAHTCAAYDPDPGLLPELTQRLGPVRFDRIRVAFAGEYTDIRLDPEEEPTVEDTTAAAVITAALTTRSWSTPGDTALAFEGEETGDGRIFAAGSVYWEAGPWPLQYAEEMMGGHDGAELAGSIETVGRDGARITGTGLIYTGRSAGDDAVALLDEEAPLGVSVDLDSVNLEFVDKTVTEGADGEIILRASLAQASVMRLNDGSWAVTADTAADWTASAGVLTRARHRIQFITGPGGVIPAAAVKAAFGQSGILTAAAGDPDTPDEGVVVWTENAGDFLCRITSARLRGATLVSVPAYDQARIVLDPEDTDAQAAQEATAADAVAAADLSETHLAVVGFVATSPVPVGSREVAAAVGISVDSARGHLAQATAAGRIVKLARGQYVAATTEPQATEPAEVAASADDSGLLDLVASAWTAMRDTDPMPAAWFREPTVEELPPGSGGVHYSGGRVFGWVAQAGEPHAGIPGRKVTIDSLGAIDMTHFLRAKFRLDDGRAVRAGAMTMNTGHHRDGAECETAACQFDDSRTVAAIITVGMSSRGMWFSGAAAPWLSEWDRKVFAACQPSYHLRQPQGGGKWQLRAVLSVPVPGHSSPLLASAVAERSNLALAASAALADTAPDRPDSVSGHGPDLSADVSGPGAGHRADQDGHRPDSIAEAVASLLTGPVFLDQVAEAMERRTQTRAEIDALTASIAPACEEITAGTAGIAPKGA